MFYGLLDFSFLGYFLAFLVLTQLTIASVTLYLHRCQSHKGLRLHPIVSHFFRFWLWLTTGMVTKEWVAVHRKHHAECETENDPHSPQIYGLKRVFFGGTWLYRKEARNQETLKRYGTGTPDDWIERNVYTALPWLGITTMFVLDVVFLGVPGILMWLIQMAWIPMFAAGVINGIGHFWGYRNFECPDQARNIVPWGILIGGEELHNNHHTFPASAKLSVKWWEFDMGWLYIKVLSFFKLAKPLKVPPKLTRVRNKTKIDKDTLYALIYNRFQIMSRYSKDVMLPVLRQERQRAGDAGRHLLRRARFLLIRDASLVDESAKQRLARILARNKALEQVYQYRIKLQDIWTRTTASQKELLEALQEWCRQAEATGIDALSNFAKRLRTYAPKPV